MGFLCRIMSRLFKPEDQYYKVTVLGDDDTILKEISLEDYKEAVDEYNAKILWLKSVSRSEVDLLECLCGFRAAFVQLRLIMNDRADVIHEYGCSLPFDSKPQVAFSLGRESVDSGQAFRRSEKRSDEHRGLSLPMVFPAGEHERASADQSGDNGGHASTGSSSSDSGGGAASCGGGTC